MNAARICFLIISVSVIFLAIYRGFYQLIFNSEVPSLWQLPLLYSEVLCPMKNDFLSARHALPETFQSSRQCLWKGCFPAKDNGKEDVGSSL